MYRRTKKNKAMYRGTKKIKKEVYRGTKKNKKVYRGRRSRARRRCRNEEE